MSDDPKQEFFSDGITEEIIKRSFQGPPSLRHCPEFHLHSIRVSLVAVKQSPRNWGFGMCWRVVYEKTEDKVRITTQLIDALTGYHLWAEKYDRHLKDIFAIQDEISFKVVTALQVKLTDGEQALIVAGGTTNFEAYARFLKGMEYAKRVNREGNLLARKMGEEAIALDPIYPRGYRLLATTHWLDCEAWL